MRFITAEIPTTGHASAGVGPLTDNMDHKLASYDWAADTLGSENAMLILNAIQLSARLIYSKGAFRDNPVSQPGTTTISGDNLAKMDVEYMYKGSEDANQHVSAMMKKYAVFFVPGGVREDGAAQAESELIPLSVEDLVTLSRRLREIHSRVLRCTHRIAISGEFGLTLFLQSSLLDALNEILMTICSPYRLNIFWRGHRKRRWRQGGAHLASGERSRNASGNQ